MSPLTLPPNNIACLHVNIALDVCVCRGGGGGEGGGQTQRRQKVRGAKLACPKRARGRFSVGHFLHFTRAFPTVEMSSRTDLN